MAEIHKDCGGEIVKRTCLKCGKKWGAIKYLFDKNIEIPDGKFDPQEHRKRIRERRDLP